MTADLRHLAHRVHDRLPTAHGPAREWALEKAVELAGDFSEPGMLEVARVTLGWSADRFAVLVEQMLDLADEVADAEANGPASRWHTAVDKYAALLTTIASGPLIESLDEALAIVAEPVRTPSDELAARRSR